MRSDVARSGTGDVATDGACKADVKHFCQDIRPGEGRIAACLTNQQNEESKGNNVGRRISDDCHEAIREFKIDRGVNINKDLPLARACTRDVGKFCNGTNVYPEPGAIITCLREVKPQLEQNCRKEIQRTQQSAAKDYAVDAMLNSLCSGDAKKLCKGVNPGEGRVQYCLRSQRAQLTWDCQSELFRQELENSDDIRLSVQLLRKCAQDKKRYCDDVQPGNARVKDCLEDHRDKQDFSSECRSELESMMKRRAGDFRLDSRLRELCRTDIEDICGFERQSLDPVKGDDGRVSECLQDYRDELQSPACRTRVKKLTERASSDIRLNRPLADACYQDRRQLCSDVQPGDARMMRCLMDQRDSLTYECRATLFDQEVRLSENVDFQYPIKKHCAQEIKEHCSEVPKGSGRVLSCLAHSAPREEFNGECKSAVERYQKRQGDDYRLNYRLNRACEVEVDKLCPDVCSPFQGSACGGAVLKCLSENKANISDTACRREVFNVQRGWALDFRTDSHLRSACQEDVDKFCSQQERSKGQVHECLRQHRTQISHQCAAQELKLNILQSSDIRLRPGMYKDCSEEIAVYCKGVNPGQERVYKCLENNMGNVGFSNRCKMRLQRKMHAAQSYYKLDYGVKSACASEVRRLCGDAEQEQKSSQASQGGSNGLGSGSVLKCLVSKNDQIKLEACQTEVSRAVRDGLWHYTNGSPLTAVCDDDVSSHCGTDNGGRSLSEPGAAGRCLARRVAEAQEVTEPCAMLVRLAAPSDPKKLFDDSMTTAAVVTRMEKMEQTATEYGLSKKDGGTGRSVVTLTGWVALASLCSLIAVVMMGTYYLMRRYVGHGRGPYQLVVKGAPDAPPTKDANA